MSSGRGSYNLKIVECGYSVIVFVSITALVVSLMLSSPKWTYVFKALLSLIFLEISTSVNSWFTSVNSSS